MTEHSPGMNSVSRFELRLGSAVLAISSKYCIIDVRSQSEFDQGYIPGAYNVPMLSDQERSEVGLTYKRLGKSAAVALGLELFAPKIASVLSSIDEKIMQSGSRKTLVFSCARGGMRSKSVCLFLRSMGYQALYLAGGYKSFRSEVLTAINSGLAQHNLLVLYGKTGSGKTEIVRALKNRNLPALDFEDIAKHRGSAFGHIGFDEERTQQQFENILATEYFKLRTHPVIVVEHEGAIGPIILPQALRKHINSSPMVYLNRAMDSRITAILQEYVGGKNLKQAFLQALSQFEGKITTEELKSMYAFIEADNYKDAIRLIIEKRYDKTYSKSFKRHVKNRVAVIDFTELEHCITTLKTIIQCMGFSFSPESIPKAGSVPSSSVSEAL